MPVRDTEWEKEPGDRACVILFVARVRPSMTIHSRWLYSLFIAMDANFRLKQKTRRIKDPELGPGLAYFMNTKRFDAHLNGQQLQLSYYISCVGKQGKKYKCAVGNLPLYLLCWPR